MTAEGVYGGLGGIGYGTTDRSSEQYKAEVEGNNKRRLLNG